uniref:FBD domain-containing protein n=1 Tax=Davidia involucrata TaxID=16924 RepID=A0A5B7C408_DAVIN
MLECVNVGLFMDHMFALCTKDEEEEGNEDGMNILINDQITQETENVLLEILRNFKEATSFQICNWCIQMLSCRERRDIGRLRLHCVCLHLSSKFQKWELPGIVFLLKACQNLEKLLITMPPFDEEIDLPEDYLMRYEFHANGYFINETQAFIHPLQNLKTVEIRNFEGDYQTWEPGSFEMHRFFHGAELGIELMILLRGVTVNLERVIFSTKKQKHVLPILG